MYIKILFLLAGDSKRRKGATKKPKFKYLDPTDVWAILHLWIRTLYFFWILFQHLNARDIFPKRIPTMRGQKKGPIINERIELERQKLIKKASQKPICMVIDTPDPHGKTHNTKYTSFLSFCCFCRKRWQ